MQSEFVDFDYYENEAQKATLSDFITNVRRQLSQGFAQQVQAENGPVHMLGREYTDIDELNEAFKRLPWVTYRFGFNPITRTEVDGKSQELISDSGWGCTIRAGQMLLLVGLMRAKGKTDWPDLELLAMIQDCFTDAPFSLKQVTSMGNEMGRLPGDWFSPSNMCFAIEWLITHHQEEIRAKVFLDGVIYEDQIDLLGQGIPTEALKELCRCPSPVEGDVCHQCHKPIVPKGEWNYSVLVMLPMMLGLDMVNSELYSCYKAFLKFPQSIGIIGGKPRSALYIVGSQEDSLLYLDPHFSQPSARTHDELSAQASSYTCELPLLLPLKQAESSLGVGFLFSNKPDFIAFKEKAGSLASDLVGLLSIQAKTPDYLLFEEASLGQTLVFSDSDSEYILL